MKECNLSEKMFKNSMDKIERVYKLDINSHQQLEVVIVLTCLN